MTKRAFDQVFEDEWFDSKKGCMDMDIDYDDEPHYYDFPTTISRKRGLEEEDDEEEEETFTKEQVLLMVQYAVDRREALLREEFTKLMHEKLEEQARLYQSRTVY